MSCSSLLSLWLPLPPIFKFLFTAHFFVFHSSQLYCIQLHLHLQSIVKMINLSGLLCGAAVTQYSPIYKYKCIPCFIDMLCCPYPLLSSQSQNQRWSRKIQKIYKKLWFSCGDIYHTHNNSWYVHRFFISLILVLKICLKRSMHWATPTSKLKLILRILR